MRYAAGLPNSLLAKANKLGMKRLRHDVPQAIPSHFDISLDCKSLTRLSRLRVHLGERVGIQMTLVECDATLFDDAGHNARLRAARTDCTDAAIAPRGNAIDFRTHP